MHLVFLHNRKEVSAAISSLKPSAHVKLVAMTAESAQYMEELQIPYKPVSAYANIATMDSAVYNLFCTESYNLAQEIENYIAQHYPGARFENPGFLSGLSYYLQYAVNVLLLRPFLMREAILACSPDIVTVFGTDIDPWFAGCGYERQPWYDIIDDLSRKHQFRFEVQPLSESGSFENKGISIPSHQRFITTCKSVLKKSIYLKKVLARKSLLSNFSGINEINTFDQLQGLRLLMVNSYGYDWQPFLSVLQSVKDSQCFLIEEAIIEPYTWANYYKPFAYSLWKTNVYKFRQDTPSIEEEERNILGELFDKWRQTRTESSLLNIMGMNLFPALANYLRTMVSFSPTLARHTDAFASRLLDVIKPHVICFMGMINLAEQRLAFECRKRNIPVVCYQHGGGFGVTLLAKDEQTEVAHADYFLTHGDKVRPRKNPAFPIRAKYIPIGSARIEAMNSCPPLKKVKSNEIINVLWIAESCLQNRHSSPLNLEDTERYYIQKQGLEMLSTAKNIQVTFRPSAATLDCDEIIRLLSSVRYASISVDARRPLDELIHECDVVIISTGSPTTWEEVIGLKKPLILFTKTPMDFFADYFIQDLNKSCYWCKSEDALYQALNRLLSEGMDFISELRRFDTDDFIRKYVLCRDDGQCVQRVATFMKTIYRKDG
jgi:hypothetical protein